ncbi:helix-turn-helix domain-containing protein [Streptomyces sp. NPDC053079]|uniref:helix-turn-helix domain-containing protein n=1 Tax=Streptomyces sp. NPDC053079 TaxID=3365697 RepID=UPI0037D73AD7
MAGGDESGTPAQRLGVALRALQRRSGRTLRSLESEVPISDSSLSRYFQGRTVPPWAAVRDLCRALGADPAEYRALWEAADRSQPRPADAPAPASAPAPDATGVRPRGRWAHAAAGLVGGTLLGAALAALALPQNSGDAGGSRTPARTLGKGAGTVPDQHRGPSDAVRIFVSRATGACLDHSLDKQLRSYACNGMSYQRWTVHPFPDGTRQLRNHATGACLAHDDAGLRVASCSFAPSTAQSWSLTASSDESVEVRSKATGRCLADGVAGLQALSCDRSQRQKWG